jgi:hypothetical protein
VPRPRVRSVVAFASTLTIPVSCLLSGEARAQVDTRWQAGMNAQVGVTDNVAQTPDPAEGDPNAVSPEADGLGIVSPSVALIMETAGASHTLAYAFGATLYFTHPEANSYSNGISYTSRYVLSPTVDLALGVGAAYTQTNAFNILNGAAATVVGVQPADPVEVVSFTAAQGLEIALSDVWSLNETVAGTALLQVGNDTRNYLLTGTVGATREFTLDTFGMGVGADFLFQPESEAAAENRQLILRAFGSWTRALSEDWSSTLSAGGILARQLGQAVDENALPIPSQTVVQPYGRAGIDFQNDFGTAGFSVEHTVAPNVLTGSAQLSDLATLRGGLPLGQTGLLLAGTGAAGIAQVLEVDGTFSDDVVLLFVADVGLGYVVPALPELTLDLRYQFTRQAPADGAADPDAQIQGITRNTALLGATIVWPPAEGGAANAAGGASPVFRPTPAGNEDILGGVRDAREQRAQEAEDQERRERRNGGTDSDGQYDGVRSGGGDGGSEDEE